MTISSKSETFTPSVLPTRHRVRHQFDLRAFGYARARSPELPEIDAPGIAPKIPCVRNLRADRIARCDP